MNETTKKQSERLLAVGFPDVGVLLDRDHHIILQPVTLGKLWDAVRALDTWYDFRNDLTSAELIEALVQILEDHYIRKHGKA